MAYPDPPTGLRVIDAGYVRSLIDDPPVTPEYLEVGWDAVAERVEVKVYAFSGGVLGATGETPLASIVLRPFAVVYWKIEARRRYPGSGLGNPATLYFPFSEQ